MSRVKRAPVPGGAKTGESSQGIPSRSAPAGPQVAGLPTRPCLAGNLVPVDLRANYFDLTFTAGPLTVYKYTFKVLGSNNKEIRGATAKKVFKSALSNLEAQPDEYATDFQQQIVTLNPLKIPDKDKKLLDIEGFEGCAIEFEHTMQIQLGPSVLASPSPDVIDCLSLIMGQWAREQNQIVTIGRHRFFRESYDLDPNDPESKHPESKHPESKHSKSKHPKSKHPESKHPESKHHFETDIPERVSIVRGFFQSVRPAKDKLLLNANPTIAVFRPAGNVGVIHDVVKTKTGSSAAELTAALIKLHGVIAKARVSYKLPGNTNNPKEVRIAGFARRDDKDSKSKDAAHPLMIDNDFPRPTEVRFWIKNEYRTVCDHFKQRGFQIREDLPLINMGKPGRAEYVPAEFCTVLWGQPLRWKVTEIPGLTPSELNKLNEFTCQPPKENQRWIESVPKQQNLNVDRDANKVLGNFGVSVDKELLKVNGRKLASPKILCWDKKPAIKIEDASWNMVGRLLARGPSSTKSWTWIYFSGDSQNNVRQEAEEGLDKLDGSLKQMWPPGSQPELVSVEDRRIPRGEGIAGIRASLARAAQNSKIGLVVVVCPNKLPVDTYNALKFFGDIQIGIHTSCILARKFKRKIKNQSTNQWTWKWNDSYFSNVALKINLKLGGINQKLEKGLELKENGALMVVGYDVTHPTGDEESAAEKGASTEGDGKGVDDGSKQSIPFLPGDKSLDITKKRSQVGLVISAAEDLGQWLSSYWNQKPRQEMTDSTLYERFVTLLQAWRSFNAINANKPLFNVIIYRDGVSESQFDQVLQQEVPQIRRAYKEVFGLKRVRITLVVAIKRHATRFFPVKEQDGDSNENIKPGTVVDNGVTQPKYWEFFLAAHSALKGTAKPTRYVVVLDEIFQNDFTNDSRATNSAAQLEGFTHDLSYLFGRANKAVSVCTPAYYADILCTRARAYMSALANPVTRSEIENSIADKPEEVKRRVLAGDIHPILERSMYWI